MMNLKVWFSKMFNDNRTDEGLRIVRSVGKDDGVAMTTAYADGFLEGVGEVLQTRLIGFHQVVDTTASQAPVVKRITARRK